MKLSSKGRYGVRALFDIAFYNDGRATQVKEIAQRQQIPVRFLEQIFQDLKRAGLVASKRGPRGGYQLAMPASQISLADVIRALEGAVAVFQPVEEPGKVPEPDVTGAVFRDLAADVEKCFAEVSINDVCQRGRELGLRRGRGMEELPDYAI